MPHDPPLGLRVWSGRARGMPRPHRHGDLELNYVRAGRMTYLVGSRLIELPHHRLAAVWGPAPHRMVCVDSPPELTWVTIPLDRVVSWQLPAAFMARLIRETVVVDGAPLDTDAIALNQWARDLAEGSDPYRHIVLSELEARLRRMALGLEPRRPSPKRAGREPSLEAIRRMSAFIASAYREDIRIADIAAAVGLHPNYAMTLFRRQTGVTLNQFLSRQRVAEAQRLLLMTNRPILEIALACGFGSISRFYEAFTHFTGSPPHRFRRARGGGAAKATAEPPPAGLGGGH